MDLDAKFDLLFKTIAENERKREEAEVRTRAEYLDLKKSVESRIPAVEKRVEDLGASLQSLSTKVEHLEGSLMRHTKLEPDASTAKTGGSGIIKEEQNQPNTDLTSPSFGMNENFSLSRAPFGFEPRTPSLDSGIASYNLSSTIPPMTCPQFCGDNPQMWKVNCEQYFDVFGIQQIHWVKIATLNFCGNAAFWLQSVRNQLGGITWVGLCDLVCSRFSKDRQQALIRQWFHIRQDGSVAEYVEKFDSLMHQLLAYDNSLLPVYFVTKFVEGLRSDIRVVVLVQRPQDMDSACAVALLQEEALEGVQSTQYKKPDTSIPIRNSHKGAGVLPSTLPPKQLLSPQSEDRRGTESARARDDKLSALKAYRRSKGLCFTCGERWSRDHKCSTAVQLHVVQELLDALQDVKTVEVSDGEQFLHCEDTSDLMAISQQAIWGTESPNSFRLRGWVQGTELLMLVDSGSTHSFMEESIGLKLAGVKPLRSKLSVKLADGETLSCSYEVTNCRWWMQGHNFINNFRLLNLGGYDIILGMDWLEQFSPMQVNWVDKWMDITISGQPVRLQGIVSQVSHCSPISTEQCLGMVRQGSLMYLVQLTSSDPVTKEPIPAAVQQLIDSFQAVFAEPNGLPPKRYCDHTIPLVPGAAPVNLRPYRFNPALKDEIEQQISDMLKSGVIQPSHSAFSSPALLVKKKDGTWRLVIDYRKLNAITVKGTYPMPVIDELLDELAHAKWFTKLDLRAGYHQIRMAPGEEYKTAFQTHTGHYEYTVMSFGLTGAPATFQGAMNETLSPVLRKFALVFFDDILIYSPDFSSHLDHIAQVLSLLSKHQWYVKLSKCSFAQKQLTYLGHTISAAGVHTDQGKIQEVVNWKVPTTVKKLRGFLGLAGYYRKFVKGFGVISKPLTNLLRKGVPFIWTPETDAAFHNLKQALVSAPVLALPDFQKVFTVETDASDSGIGAVLSQDGHPVAYISKALGPRTKGLSTYEKECMAVLLAVDQWRSYLQLGDFIILTDHHSLMHLSDQRLHTPWQHKAFTKLLGLSYKICYRRGSHNGAADALSRKFQHDEEELCHISACTPTWLQEVTTGYASDSYSSQLLTELTVQPNARKHFSLHAGLLKYKGRIWIGNNRQLQLKLLTEVHSNPIGGHSGFPVTYRKLKQLFAWPSMKKMTKLFVQQCQICLQAKPDRAKYPGLLQPLPVPEGAWQVVSLDFIEGLPVSDHASCILVVVDKFSKYAHFLPYKSPFHCSWSC